MAGLRSARAKAKTLPVGELRTISVAFDGEVDTMTFRVPGLVAIKDAIRHAEEAASQFGLPADMAVQVVLLGKTYVPTQEDGAINPTTEFAQMAQVQPALFTATCTAHGEAMADSLDWLTIKSAVKNDSGGSAPEG